MWLLAVSVAASSPKAANEFGTSSDWREIARQRVMRAVQPREEVQPDAPAIRPGRPATELVETWADGLRVDSQRAEKHMRKLFTHVLGEDKVAVLSRLRLTELTASVWVSAMLCVALVGGMLLHVRAPSNKKEEQPEVSVSQLALLCSFRLYGGLLVMTWLPYVLVKESAHFWPEHKTLFMGVCKLTMGLSMAFAPVFGYLNDRTKHPWGRRRVWFVGGVSCVIVGILLAAFSSSYQGSGWIYVLTVVLWMFGESAADSSAEALVPDLCAPKDFNAAASVRTVTFCLGALGGCIAIILLAAVGARHQWFYVIYLLMVGLTAPWTIKYAVPKEDEGEECAETEASMLQACYGSVLNISDEFRTICAAVALFTASLSGNCFLFWFLSDVVGVQPRYIALHFGILSIVFFVGALLSSAGLSFVVLPAIPTAKVFMLIYAFLDLLQPATVLFGTSTSAHLSLLYLLCFAKGLLFGGCNNLMQSAVWGAIPLAWRGGIGSVSRMMAFVAVCRCVAAGVGNLLAGVVLDLSARHSHSDLYPLGGFVAVHGLCSLCAVAAVMVLGGPVKQSLD